MRENRKKNEEIRKGETQVKVNRRKRADELLFERRKKIEGIKN